jgi:outer membrane receptor protein involved in Fe transport
VPAPWNDPHRLMPDAQIPVDAGWSVQVAASQQWRGRWAFRRAYYNHVSQRSGSNPEGLDLSRPEDDRQPLHRRLDLHVHYRASMNGVRISASAGLLNVLNRTNAFDHRLVNTDARESSLWAVG